MGHGGTSTGLPCPRFAFNLSPASMFSVEGWNVEVATAAESTTLSLTKNVPEPTTATLSPLALAGLAARRRRK